MTGLEQLDSAVYRIRTDVKPWGQGRREYRSISRIAYFDDWGVLEVSNGALMKSDWSAVIVAAPQTVNDSSIKDNGWTLELKSAGGLFLAFVRAISR